MPTVEEQLVEANRKIQRLTTELRTLRARDALKLASLQALEANFRELQRLYTP